QPGHEQRKKEGHEDEHLLADGREVFALEDGEELAHFSERVSFDASQSLLCERPLRMTVIEEKQSSALSRMGVDFDAAYNDHVPVMIGLAVDRFHVSESDAQTLAHQVFLAFFLKADDIRDHRAWFVGAISNACRHYLRTRSRDVELSAD